MKERFFAIVNPAAGGGRCGKLAPAALERVRGAGVDVEVAQSRVRKRLCSERHQSQTSHEHRESSPPHCLSPNTHPSRHL